MWPETDILIRLRFTLLFLIFSVSIVANAASTTREEKPKPWYQVELILFTQPQPAVESSEQWDNWSKKRIPINYKDSIEIRYPEQKSNALNDDEQYATELTNDADKVFSYKQVEQIVAESLKHKEREESVEEPVVELQPFTFAPVTEWVLGDLFERLNRSDKYQMLIHTAWIQPGLEKDEAISIHIHDHMALANNLVDETDNGDELSTELLVNANNNPNALTGEAASPLSPSSTATSYPLDSAVTAEPGFFEQSYNRELNNKQVRKGISDETELAPITFNGTLKVFLSRYLHVEFNLDYAPQGFPQELGNTTNEITHKISNYIISGDSLSSIANGDNLNPFYETSDLDMMLANRETIQQVVYHLQQSRRMRSKKLHYIDHPKLGVLIKIMPVEIPQKDTAVEQDGNKS
ncbi:MAG TPA: hypothetical protein ENH92_03005 [Ectothiorhodospiraceae bacterium]|nr:hypothetical protein [Ectothiorhodospiraceae bacterium]